MKKVNFVLVLVVLVLVSTINVSGKYNDDLSIICYNMNPIAMEEYLNNPDISTLNTSVVVNNSAISEYVCIYSEKEGKVFDNINVTYQQASARIYNTSGNFIVDEVFFDFISKGNLQNILIDNGVNAKINSRVMVNTDSMAIALYTDSGVFFIVNDAEGSFDGYIEDYENYKFYTFKEFKDRFMVRKGRNIYNGEEVQNSYLPLFMDHKVWVPIRSVLNYVAEDIKWDDRERSISFNIDKDKYILYTIEGMYLDARRNDMQADDIPWKALGIYFVKDGHIYIQEYAARGILEAYNKSMVVDYDKGIISIADR